MNSHWKYIEQEGLLQSLCPGCQIKSKDFEEHCICTSMPVFSYATEQAINSTYDGSSTNYTDATKTTHD